jgi:predicted nucleotidyltransferase component of viral defense system
MMSILLDISKNEILKENLVFKWWTYFFLLYGLDRFSTDLDFDLVGEWLSEDFKQKISDNRKWSMKENLILEEVGKLAEKYWEVKEKIIKKHTIFVFLSYGEIDHNIKIEISRRWVSWEYSLKNFMWIELNTLDVEYATANKFFALTDRNKLANRDIYDIWFILKNNLPINKEYLSEISWKSFEEYIKFMIEFLKKFPKNYNVLDWLWTTLSDKQKLFVKNHLIWETMFLLNSLN